ncbi:GSCOCG00012755001-RA-CDS, partial [Cotesia congregata]
SEKEAARQFFWECVNESLIRLPKNNIHSISMSQNGIDFEDLGVDTDADTDADADSDADADDHSRHAADNSVNKDISNDDVENNGSPTDDDSDEVYDDVRPDEETEKVDFNISHYFVKNRNILICIVCSKKFIKCGNSSIPKSAL